MGGGGGGGTTAAAAAASGAVKIRLKLSEPSIEKVWLFSLLFVVLSIVVSMGGLIVLPFVKKTTRRRILTLFEGLAVGGLTGSATLHMFPQAFGLVDENYHRYFWTIFVVFLGIYLCYLCERTINILKVVRAKMRRRSRASLIEMNFRYGLAGSLGRELLASGPRGEPLGPGAHAAEQAPSGQRLHTSACAAGSAANGPWARRRKVSSGVASAVTSSSHHHQHHHLNQDHQRHQRPGVSLLEDALRLAGKSEARRSRREGQGHGASVASAPGAGQADARKLGPRSERGARQSAGASTAALSDSAAETGQPAAAHLELDQSLAPARERLIKCLKSVRSQFSPVYAVFNQPANEDHHHQSQNKHHQHHQLRQHLYLQHQERGGHRYSNHSKQQQQQRRRQLREENYATVAAGAKWRRTRHVSQAQVSEMLWKQSARGPLRRGRLSTVDTDELVVGPAGGERSAVRAQEGSRPSSTAKRHAKRKDIETMLYHRNLVEQQKCRSMGAVSAGQCRSAGALADENGAELARERQDQDNPARMSVDTVPWMILFGDGLLNVIDGLSIGAAFERNILAGISISVAVMLEEVTHRLGTTAILIRTGMSIKQSFLCTFLSACALFPGMIVGIMLSDATDEATPYIFCAAGGIFLYTGLVDVMKEMNRSLENAMRKDIKTTLKIFALQNVGIILAVIFLSFLALYEPDFEEYQKILDNSSSSGGINIS